MSQTYTYISLLETFGIRSHMQKLQQEGNHEQIRELEKMVSEFILVKALEDLPQEAKVKLEHEEISDGPDLLHFFSEHIPQFTNKLRSYGTEFRTIISQ